MKKHTVKDKIFTKHYNGIISYVPFSDLPKDLQPDDLIDIEKVEGYYSENNSWDAHTILTISRERLQTDEEFEKYKSKIEKMQAESKKERYEKYLKLKKEFESENSATNE